MKDLKTLFKQPAALILSVALSVISSGLSAAPNNTQENIDHSNLLRLEQPISMSLGSTGKNILASGLDRNVGPTQVIVRLKSPALAAVPDQALAVQTNYRAQLQAQQGSFLQRVQGLDPQAKVIAQTQMVLNAVFMEVDSKVLDQMAKDPDIARIAPVGHYEMDLQETVPYIGAETLQTGFGLDGEGVSVAVLDSGIDYNHASLGGSGDPADYAANDGAIIEPGTFPTDRVVGGIDFVGNVWPDGPLMPDADPIDDEAAAPGSGHGTHVADIIAGSDGVAPGADLYAVKVCSSISSSCNGIALIQGMEYAVDPNGDGDTSDHIDIVNMSLGSGYGQSFDDDLSTAVDNASALGVLTVASAGNCGDNPFCTGTPAAAQTALSVAQTQVPSATGYTMNVLEPEAFAGEKLAVRYAWTPDVTELVEGSVQYADIAATNLNGCAPFIEDLTGLIVAVDRGACNFSDKIRNIENAGGILGIVMLIDDSAPFAGSFGGGDPINIPGFNISLVDGDILRGGDALVQFGPEFSFSLAGTTVSSTARGPDMYANSMKPEIGAPGASISAEVGTGVGNTPFGGTSGAAPMVAGAAALLQQDCRLSGETCTPLEIKAKLMNSAFRDVGSDTTGGLAELTRVGAGEVRVDASAFAPIFAYSLEEQQPALSFGVFDGSGRKKARRTLRVTNVSDERQTITVIPEFDSELSDAAVDIIAPKKISLKAGQSKTVKLQFRIYGAEMPANFMNSGSNGNNPAALSANEITGNIRLNHETGKTGGSIVVPWHIIGRQASNVRTERNRRIDDGGSSFDIANFGHGTAQLDTYTVFGLSDEKPRGERGAQAPSPDIKAVGVSTFPVPAGVCSDFDSFIWAFAFNTWDRQSHLMPVSHQVILDINQDGEDDFAILNRDDTFNNISGGRQLSWVFDIASGEMSAFFFAEHASNSSNTVLLACAEQFGMSAADLGTTAVNVSTFTTDFYFGGPSDDLGPFVLTPGAERFIGQPSGDLGYREFGSVNVFDVGATDGDSPSLGVMMLTNGDRGAGARGASTITRETILYYGQGVTPPRALRGGGILPIPIGNGGRN